MNIKQPLLKPAVQVCKTQDAVHLVYRGQQLCFNGADARHFNALCRYLDGRHPVPALATRAGVAPRDTEWMLLQLDSAHMLVEVEHSDASGELVGAEHAFWLLEADLCHFKFGSRDPSVWFDLEGMIARGEVRQEVAEGYLIELGYLLRQVPQELALAVATSPNEQIRSMYVEFFKEECDHGKMIFDQIKTWIDPQQVLAMRPLPGTVAVLNTYRALACDDALSYAVALMRDESTPLDPSLQKVADPYHGLRMHYTVPARVVDIFEWHTNLDRDCDHGFFPLEIFRSFSHLDRATISALRGKMTSLFEVHAMWRRNLLEYYNDHSVLNRVSQ